MHKNCEDNHYVRNDWLQVQSQNKSQQNISKGSDLLRVDGTIKDGKMPFYGYTGMDGNLKDCG